MPMDPQRLADELAELDVEAAISVVTAVIQARPEMAPPIVNFAVPDFTYPPARLLVERRAKGSVKSYNKDKGYAFIECNELREVFGNDVWVHHKQMVGFDLGSQVNFAVALNKDNKPQAFDLCSEDASGGRFAADKGGGKGGGGKGYDAYGPAGGKGGYDRPPGFFGDAPPAPYSAGKGKSKGGGGAPTMTIQIGQRRDHHEQRPSPYSGGGPGLSGRPSSGKSAPSSAGKSSGGKDSKGKGGPNVAEELGTFTGTIKSFSEKNGYGFVDSQDLKQMGHQSDCFMHHMQFQGFAVGDAVDFTAYLTSKGQLQCKDLQAVSY